MELDNIAVRCPDCGLKFMTRQVREFVDTGLRNSELRQHIGEVTPCYEPYASFTCPSCGRADWSSAFDAVFEECALFQARTTPHLQYRAAALRAAQKERNYYDAGIFYLHAAWCADDGGAVLQSKEYRRLAIEVFQRSLSDVSCPLDSRIDVEYLIGELLRRIGQFEACRSHFASIIGHLPPNYAVMARKLMRLADLQNSELVAFDTAA